MYPQTESTKVVRGLTVSFVRLCQRITDDAVWDIVDYHFSVKTEGDVCNIAVGIDGDWQDRLSALELRKLAETWLLHRLEHFYEPFGEVFLR